MAGNWTQYRPVKERAEFDYSDSSVVHSLVDGRKVRLTKCRRSDDRLFRFYSQEVITDDEAEKFGKKECRFSVSYLNRTRKIVNRKWMEREKSGKKKVEFLEANKHDNNSQDMWLYKGLPVICCRNNAKMGVFNNQQFVLKTWDKKVVKIIEKAGEVEHVVEVPLKRFVEFFRPGYCITTHAAQAATFDEEYTIHDWKRLCNRGRDVALSRGTKMENVNIVEKEKAYPRSTARLVNVAERYS